MRVVRVLAERKESGYMREALKCVHTKNQKDDTRASVIDVDTSFAI